MLRKPLFLLINTAYTNKLPIVLNAIRLEWKIKKHTIATTTTSLMYPQSYWCHFIWTALLILVFSDSNMIIKNGIRKSRQLFLMVSDEEHWLSDIKRHTTTPIVRRENEREREGDRCKKIHNICNLYLSIAVLDMFVWNLSSNKLYALYYLPCKITKSSRSSGYFICNEHHIKIDTENVVTEIIWICIISLLFSLAFCWTLSVAMNACQMMVSLSVCF